MLMPLTLPSFWISLPFWISYYPSHLPVVTITNLSLDISLDSGLDEMIYIKHLAQCLAHSKTSANISYYCY